MSKSSQAAVTSQPRVIYRVKRDEYENNKRYHEPKNKTTSTTNKKDTTNKNVIRTRDLKPQKPTTKTGITMNQWLIGGGVALGVCILAAVVVTSVLLTRKSPATSSSTSSSSINTVYWAFDNDANDLYSTYNGTLMGGAAFSSTTYFGYGYNLQLNSSLNQSVIVTTPFLNLSYTSFTVEAWIYGVTLSGDVGIFSQCQCSTCQNQCLYLIIRNARMYMGFMLNDLVGTTSLSVNTWYHVAYVYDYSVQTQYIYLQGVLEGSKSSASPYQGQNGSTVIGLSYVSASAFNGYIDNLKVTTRAKSATEILTDASVVAYFSFDGSSLTDDSGPNLLNATLSNAAAVSGKVGQGLAFSGSVSYFQAYGFYQLGQSNKAFSFSIWIYPYSVTGGTLIAKSTVQNGSSSGCDTMMGLTYVGQIGIHTYGSSRYIIGPFISALQWTHIAYTYSNTNGQTLYINGVQYATTGSISYSTSGGIEWVTIGYNFGFTAYSPIIGGYYFGVVDECYIFRRELSASDVSSLANP